MVNYLIQLLIDYIKYSYHDYIQLLKHPNIPLQIYKWKRIWSKEYEIVFSQWFVIKERRTAAFSFTSWWGWWIVHWNKSKDTRVATIAG